MANINALVKRKQLHLAGSAFSGTDCDSQEAWYFSEMDMSGNTNTVGHEPAPDLTGVVDSQFDGKVRNTLLRRLRQHRPIKKQFSTLRQEIDLLSEARQEDQRRIEALSAENKKLSDKFGEPGSSKATTPGNGFATQPLSNGISPEGEPLPSTFPPAGNGTAVPPPPHFILAGGEAPPSQVTYKSVPVPGQINRQEFSYGGTDSAQKKYPYIPTGSFAKSILIEGADANASVTGSNHGAHAGSSYRQSRNA